MGLTAPKLMKPNKNEKTVYDWIVIQAATTMIIMKAPRATVTRLLGMQDV